MARCLSPFRKKDTQIDLPCGKCPECRMRRVSGWSFRIMKEAERSASFHWVTLTYDTDHVPITPNGFMSLQKRDVQLFFKRLRKLEPGVNVKYYVAGEYGEEERRPHYHAIIFNCSRDAIDQAWICGEVWHADAIEESAIQYTLKYMCKPGLVGKFSRDDRVLEFALMSKKLGDNYLTPAMKRWHKADLVNRYHVPLRDGGRIAMPRYYIDKIYTGWQRLRIADHIKNLSDNEYNTLSEKEKLAFDKKRDLIAIEKFRKARKDQRRTKL